MKISIVDVTPRHLSQRNRRSGIIEEYVGMRERNSHPTKINFFYIYIYIIRLSNIKT